MGNRLINIYGSSGSIGSSAIELLSGALRGLFTVNAITLHSNVSILEGILHKIQPKEIIFTNEEAFQANLDFIKTLSQKYNFVYKSGLTELLNLARQPIDISLMAISGIEAIPVMKEIVKTSKKIALANKESIVCAWHELQNIINEYQTEIIPVDSEHNSLFRLLDGQRNAVEHYTITASGGRFFGTKFADLQNITVNEALQHPIWKMGNKISIDSSTMANKVLELIEAHYLFNIPAKNLSAIVHPQALVHAKVDFQDGSSHMFFSNPDMKIHIAHALLYPKKIQNIDIKKPQPSNYNTLNFYNIKHDEFPIFYLGLEVLQSQNYENFIKFNKANDEAVALFLDGKIKYIQIYDIIKNSL